MPPKKVLIAIAAVVAAALVAFFLWRRRAAAAQVAGVSAATPTPQAALTGLLAPTPGQPLGSLPSAATSALIDYAGARLPPIVGQGVASLIPQSTPQPPPSMVNCPPGYVGIDPGSGTYCTGVAKTRSQGIADAAARALAAQPRVVSNYNPSAGYYG